MDLDISITLRRLICDIHCEHCKYIMIYMLHDNKFSVLAVNIRTHISHL